MGSIALNPASLVNLANTSASYTAVYPNSVPYAPNSYWTVAPNLSPGIPGSADGVTFSNPTLLNQCNMVNYGLASGVVTLAPGNPQVVLASGLGGYLPGGTGTLGYKPNVFDGCNTAGTGAGTVS